MLASLCLVQALLLVGSVRGYGGGAPKRACRDMEPGHGASAPRVGPAPVAVAVNATGLEDGGQTIRLRITALGQNKFKGFMIQARDLSRWEREDVQVGHFISDDGAALRRESGFNFLSCGTGWRNSITHRNKANKTSVSFMWKAPKNYKGELKFVYTVVQTYEDFWVRQETSVVRVGEGYYEKKEVLPGPRYTDRGVDGSKKYEATTVRSYDDPTKITTTTSKYEEAASNAYDGKTGRAYGSAKSGGAYPARVSKTESSYPTRGSSSYGTNKEATSSDGRSRYDGSTENRKSEEEMYSPLSSSSNPKSGSAPKTFASSSSVSVTRNGKGYSSRQTTTYGGAATKDNINKRFYFMRRKGDSDECDCPLVEHKSNRYILIRDPDCDCDKAEGEEPDDYYSDIEDDELDLSDLLRSSARSDDSAVNFKRTSTLRIDASMVKEDGKPFSLRFTGPVSEKQCSCQCQQ